MSDKTEATYTLAQVNAMLAKVGCYATPGVGSVWRHYRGLHVEVVQVVHDWRTQEELVVYRNVNGPVESRPWSRPISNWYALVNGGACCRFTYCDNNTDLEISVSGSDDESTESLE